ncbi:hypothetical protein BpHYR1_006781, partial [Brachionus plicatilis]
LSLISEAIALVVGLTQRRLLGGTTSLKIIKIVDSNCLQNDVFCLSNLFKYLIRPNLLNILINT